MSPPIPTTEPTGFVAGDTVTWSRTLPDYPLTEGWLLSYVLQGPMKLEIPNGTMVTVSGDGWLITVPAVATAGLNAGTYRWQGYVTNGAQRVMVAAGVMTVEPNLQVAPAGSQQSHNEKMLAAIQAVLQGRAVDGIESYQIAGRAVNKIPIADLLKLEQTYLAKVRQERHPESFGRTHTVTFVHP